LRDPARPNIPVNGIKVPTPLEIEQAKANIEKQKQLDLAERQLVALTMNEKERESAKSNLRKDNRFGAQYGYV